MLPKLKRIFILLLAVFLSVIGRSEASPIIVGNPFSSADTLGLSPFWDWKIIESQNFRVIFPVELGEVAQKATQYLEEAHDILSPLLRWQPTYKPQVLLIDNSDVANGVTSPFIRIGITLWITTTESWSNSAYYDDWLRLLVIHEYTHFLNMDATHGYAAWGRVLFGDAFLPSALWTPWMLEGLAVYMETRFTTSGRGRSPYYEMVLRSAVAEGVLDTRSFITLDKVNGTNPYTPGGDTRYQFGYQLMNQIAKQPVTGVTADGQTPTTGGEDLLGILSDRSSRRIPFFTNENLNGIIGKDWSKLWQEILSETQKRATEELKHIRSQPLTPYTLLTERNHEVSNSALGVAASPDGQWLAYTLGSADRRSGLFLKNIKTGQTNRIDDKYFGVALKFTADSKALVYSEFRQQDIYYTLSDLRIYSIEKGGSYALTHKARARDPDLSSDGHWITFTLTQAATTGLAIAPIEIHNGDYQLGPIRTLYMPPIYDHVANPQFSADGKKIYFTLHPNGKSQEDLLEYDLTSAKIKTLIADGFYNQFPAVDGHGDLYYVSTKTGVNNLFRFRPSPDSLQKSEMVTNFETGITAPSFAPGYRAPGERSPLYASVFSTSGWDLAEVHLTGHPTTSEAVTLDPPPAPPIDIHSRPENPPQDQTTQKTKYSIQDYSIFPSIWPRAWTPLLGWDANGLSAGAEVLGFDAVNRHRYILAGSYSTQLQTADGYFLYSNRSLGAEVLLTGSLLTSNVTTNVNLAGTSQTSDTVYSRLPSLSTQITYPILWTYSSLTPSVGFNIQQSTQYLTGPGVAASTVYSTSPVVPTANLQVTYSNQEVSNLGVTSEGGRITQLGLQPYFLSTPIWKGFFLDREYFRILKHSVLSPSIKSQWVSGLSSTYSYADAILAGRSTQNIISPFAADGFGQVTLRGYPNYNYFSTLASVGALDFTFPIARIFAGLGTHPVFLDNLYGFTFAELSYFPAQGINYFLPSAGGGLRLSGEFFSVVTTTFSLEYHQGFRTDLGGTGDFFFQIFLSALNF